MKKLVTLLILLVAFTLTTNTATRKPEAVETQMNYFWKQLTIKQEIARIKAAHKKDLDRFLEHLADRESSNNPNIVNSYGYIGKYQFGRAALKEVGCDSVTVAKFLRNPGIFPEESQDLAVIKLMKINRQRIGSLVEEFKGKTINGVQITESGLLAAAHLAGAGGVKRFLQSRGNYNPADGYGTKLTNYLKEFQNHNVNMKYV